MSAAHHILGGDAEHESEAHAAPEPDPVAAYQHFRHTLSHLKHGALHRQLGVPISKKIPHEMLEKAAKSSDALLAHRARLALTLEGFTHGHEGAHEKEFGLHDAS
jgi:hypothetical protein